MCLILLFFLFLCQQFVKNDKIAENGNADETGFSSEKKKIFLYTFPFLFIGVFVAVYYIFHLHRGRFTATVIIIVTFKIIITIMIIRVIMLIIAPTFIVTCAANSFIFLLTILSFQDEFFTNFDPYDINSGNRESQRPVKSLLDQRKRTRTEIQEERIEEKPGWLSL